MKQFVLTLISFSIFISCKNGNTPKREIFTYVGYAQGTTFSIKYDKTSGDLNPMIDTIFNEIDRSLSLYNPSSLLTKINQNDTINKIDTHFENVFTQSKKIHTATSGAFDPTVYPLIKFWGFHKEKMVAPAKIDSTEIDSLIQLKGFQNSYITNGILQKSSYKTMYDFNGIAQGYTVDKIAELFDRFSILNYMIEVGGEVRAKGKNPTGDFWKIGIDKPLENSDKRELAAIVSLNNLAMATSGSYRKYYVKDGKKYSHTIDPFTGFPVKHSLISASVITNSCAEADALATAFMVMGYSKTIEYVSKHKNINVYLISANYKGEWETYMSENLKTVIEIQK